MKKYLAEMVGTFVLTLLGCGTAVSLACGSDTASVVGTAFAFGLAVVAMAYTIGGISGCHINPAITTTPFEGTTTGANSCAGAGSQLAGLVVEIVLTFIFVLVVLGTTDAKKGAGNFAGLAIGLSLILIHLVGIHYTGTSVNPARSIGPALFEGGQALTDLWVFIVGPFIGAILSACVWNVLTDKD